MATIDTVINTAVPILVVLIIVGFLYAKVLKPWLIPLMQDAYNWVSGNKPDTKGADNANAPQKIVYETL